MTGGRWRRWRRRRGRKGRNMAWYAGAICGLLSPLIATTSDFLSLSLDVPEPLYFSFH